MAKNGLTPKQTRFVAEYLVDLNATQAAIRAGYSAKTANYQGPANLVKPSIKAAISAKQAEQLRKVNFTAEDVLRELGRVAFVDMRGFYRAGGAPKPMHELTQEQGAVLARVETIIKNAEAGDGHTDWIHKLSPWDKMKALDLLARHFKLVGDKIDVNVTVTYEERRQRLEEGRAWAAKLLEGEVVAG